MRHPTAGVRPTIVLYGNARFAVAAPGSMASPVRACRHGVERHPTFVTRPVSERDTSKFCHACQVDGVAVVLGPTPGLADTWGVRACRRCGVYFDRDIAQHHSFGMAPATPHETP